MQAHELRSVNSLEGMPRAGTTAASRPNGAGLAREPAERRSVALGWFSIGLGLAQILAPERVARLAGASPKDSTRGTMLAVGLREITCGVGILAQPQSAGWLWARVAGDLMDLVLLGRTLSSPEAHRGNALASTAAVVGVTLLDAKTAMDLGRERKAGAISSRSGIHVSKSLTVNRPVDEVYRFWRDFQNLPRFMAHLESVQVRNGHSIWRAKAPAGMTIEWEAEIVTDRPNELISWRSVKGAVPNRGSVSFVAAPGDRGTELRVELHYEPPGGALAATLAKLFGEEPSQQIQGDLRRFKQVIETGEVVHSDASIHRGMHSARPYADNETGKVTR